MKSININLDKLTNASATQFIVDKNSHHIIEADATFHTVTGVHPGAGKSACTLEALFVHEQSAKISKALNSRAKPGNIIAYTGLIKLQKKGEKPAVIVLQPYYRIDGTEQVMCILTVLEAEAASAVKSQPANLRTIDALKQAIDNDEFEVYVQPIHSLHTNLVIGGEILTHWEKSGGELMSEGYFPQFEEEEMCSELDFYILTRSLQAMSYAQSNKSKTILLSFNLSNQIFQSRGFVERITGLVEAFEIEKNQIMLEIKEELLVSGSADVLDQTAKLRSGGFKVIVDNVSGDNRLIPLIEGRKVDMVKLDQKHITGSMNSKYEHDVFENILTLSKKNNIEIISTKIEADEQKELAKQAGCSMAQGYQLAKPILLEDFLK
ncbi:MAG: EAL domain-containing protein [Clostridia bacterium]|nr:EAL domain-containing protein [Clostridia bacterium]